MSKTNIKALYDNCKNLVKEIEKNVAQGQEINKDTLNVLQNVYEQIIQFEKMYLIQCNDKFWGTVLMNMNVDIDMTQRGGLDIRFDRDPTTISLNPLFLSDYTFPEFTGLIINELIKLVYMHPAEYSKHNTMNNSETHDLLEKASSAASTSIVRSDIRLDSENGNGNKCRLPNDSFTDTSVNESCGVQTKGKMPLDYYYKILKKFYKAPPPQPIGEGPGEGPSIPTGIATRNNGDGHDVHQWEKKDTEELESGIKALISSAYSSLSEKSRGLMPAGIVQQIESMLKPPEIDWKGVLRKMVGSIPVPYRKTATRLNRRQPYRADLCGRLPKRTVNIVCAIDTSGSMRDDDIAYCLNEIFNIIKVYEGYKVTIIECDASIGRVYEARNLKEVSTKVTGRGGTSFVPVINYINGDGDFKKSKKYPNAGKYSDALLIYFTDGYGDYEIPKPRTYRNLWVIMEDEKNLSLKEAYGDVKSLKKDKDWRKMKGM